MKLTKNFRLEEFINSRFYDADSQKKVWEEFGKHESELLPKIQKLANQMQTLRDYLCTPIIINIAYRPLFWELKQGRSGTSKHIQGIACDIITKTHSPKEVHDSIEFLITEGSILQGGLGVYPNFVHYDYRGRRARW